MKARMDSPFLNLFVFLIILLNLAACYSQTPNAITPNLRDEEWLNKDNCPGCWRGLKIGETSQKDALSLVQSFSFIGGPISGAKKPGGFLCKKPPEAPCIAMLFDSGKLTRLYLTLNYQVTFEQVVEKLGMPDGFFLTAMYADGMKGCLLQVIWRERLMVLESADKPSFFGKSLCQNIADSDGQLPKGIIIQDVIYMPKDDIEDITYLWKGFSSR